MKKLYHPQYAAMLETQHKNITVRLSNIELIMSDFHKIGARFENLTSFAKAITEKLRGKENSALSHTALLRNSSPYRKILVKGWEKSNKIIKKNDEKQLERLDMALKIRDLTQQNNLKSKIIENLQIQNDALKNDRSLLLTDHMLKDENVNNIYIPFKKLLDQASKPIGYLEFDPYRKNLTAPLGIGEVFAESDFPKGFIDWYLENFKSNQR